MKEPKLGRAKSLKPTPLSRAGCQGPASVRWIL